MMKIQTMRRVLAMTVLGGLLAACGGGFSQSVGPDGVQQNAGPFHQSVGADGVSQGTGGYGPSQSVGPGGVQQSAGPFHQSVGPNGVSQGAGGPAPARAASASCQVSCGGRAYAANCPSGSSPVCQCNSQPYAGCLTPSH